MPNFYFEQVLQTALNGIDQNVTGPVLQISGVILILSLLYAVYEAYSNGGDATAAVLDEVVQIAANLSGGSEA